MLPVLIGIGIALGIANYTNPVFVGLEQDKVKGGFGVGFERQQGICDTLKIIRPHLHLHFCGFHIEPPLYIAFLIQIVKKFDKNIGDVRDK